MPEKTECFICKHPRPETLWYSDNNQPKIVHLCYKHTHVLNPRLRVVATSEEELVAKMITNELTKDINHE